MVHYGMNLIDKRATIYSVISTLFTAVTFHELFKEAAFDANAKLAFGLEWQPTLDALSDAIPNAAELDDGRLRELFEAANTAQDGSLCEKQL